MGYDVATTQREEAKAKEGWRVAIISTAAFVVVGLIVWFTGFGGKY